jgi:3-hydroxyisobutyrate dehydrogenase-like beta-hydroxyacid dehydrogenase
MTTVGLLHPGQMGAAVGRVLTDAGHEVSWCSAGRGSASASRASEAGLRAVGSVAELIAGCDVVLSICPPAAAEDVARVVAEVVVASGFRGVFVDANAISPQRMDRVAELLGRLDVAVVDGSIIGPPPHPSRSARLYLSGPAGPVSVVRELFVGTRAEPVTLSARLGDASALKMAFGSYNKASHALAAVSHALAEEYGVGAALRAEAQSDGGGALAKLHRLPSVAARAWRWGPEMLEAAESFAAVGLPSELANGASAVFERWADDKDASLDVAEALRHLRRDGDD